MAQATQALQLSSQDADALELRGTLSYWCWLMATEPDPVKAKALLDASRKDLETATQISPNQPGAWAVLSHLYNQYNDVVDAKIAARRAYDEDAYLSNADTIVWRLFLSSYDLEQLPDGIHWCEVGATRFPTDPRFMECKLWMMGTTAVPPDVPKAWAIRDSLLKHSAAGDTAFAAINSMALVAGAIGRAGLTDSAQHILARLDDRPDVDPTLDATQAKAIVWAQIGDKTNAIKALARYLSANPARAIGFDDEHSWLWRSIHDDPRFQALVVKARK
jgi:tetratricopeptide (TPR) repeat protein